MRKARTCLASTLALLILLGDSAWAEKVGTAKVAPAAPAPHAVAPGQVTPASSPQAPAAGQNRPPPNPAAQMGPPPPPPGWPPEEIAAAKQKCALLLKGLDAVVIQEEPLKEKGCGAPAPVKLISIGNHPQVSFSPPPSLTCEMVAMLGAWLKEDVQPRARALLGAPVVRVDVMSGYSCRAAYGRVANRLSEHAHMNAVDIRSFVATNAVEVGVLEDWGPTVREIAAQVAAAKAAAERAAAEAAAAERAKAAATGVAQAPQRPGAPPSNPPSPPAAVAGSEPRGGIGTLIEGVPGLRLPGPRSSDGNSGFGLSAPSRLGGPKPAGGAKPPATAALPPPGPAESTSRKAQFLREIHAAACRKFGTTLGPEANNAHKNHFHLDMAQRRSGSFCE